MTESLQVKLNLYRLLLDKSNEQLIASNEVDLAYALARDNEVRAFLQQELKGKV